MTTDNATRTKRWLSGSSLLLLVAIFIGLTIVLNVGLRGARLDLTEAKLYTVSPGTRNILGAIDEPINLYLYFSDQATADVNEPGIAGLRNYANRVRETLEEFAALAGGKLRLEVIDPLPFSEAEDDASGFGLIGTPLGRGGDNVFFGLAATNATDGIETITFFEPSKEAFLEYDLARLIYSLANPSRPVIGLLSTLPARGGFDPATRQATAPWVVVEQIEQLYDVRQVAVTSTEIDSDIDLLVLLHPQGLSDDTLFAIDQFVLGGGKLAAFVDPFAEAQQVDADPANPQAAMLADRSSTLGKLFDAWGIAFDPAQVALDLAYGLEVTGFDGRPVQHPGILGLTGDGLRQDDVALAQLGSINLASAGSFTLREDATGELLPLLQTSEQSWQTAAQQLTFTSDPRQLAAGFDGAGEPLIVAARLQGTLNSAFPERAASDAGADSAAPDPNTQDDNAPDNNGVTAAGPLAASSTPANVVIVADTDFLTDRYWVQVQRLFGQRLLNAFANNGDFVINLLDNLAGSSDLISIRGRAVSQRPFTRVQELELAAATQFRATEEQLENELRETERKLTELQASRDNKGAGVLLLNEEQQAELERFRGQQVGIRKQLRRVQADLRAGIDHLGTRLKLINILLVPLLVVAGALLVHALRRRRTAQEQSS